MFYTEEVRKYSFDVFPRQPGIPRLYRTKQAFLGCQNAPRTIHVDATAFKNDAFALPCRSAHSQTQTWCNRLGHCIILSCVRVLRPAIESPIQSGAITVLVPDEDG